MIKSMLRCETLAATSRIFFMACANFAAVRGEHSGELDMARRGEVGFAMGHGWKPWHHSVIVRKKRNKYEQTLENPNEKMI